MTGVDGAGAFLELVRALECGSSADLRAHLDERTLLHVPGTSGLAGDYQGADAIAGLLEWMGAACDGTLCFTVTCTTAGADGRLRACGTVRGQRSEQYLAAPATVEATIVGDAVREAWLSCADQPAWDRFWR